MSIRPSKFEEQPETSFEDMDTTFAKDLARNIQPKSRSSPVSRQAPAAIPTPSVSTTSSEGTTFSRSGERYLGDNRTEEEEEDDDVDEEFLNDFQEFQNRKDDFDDALRTFLTLRGRSSSSAGARQKDYGSDTNDLTAMFSKRLSIGRPTALRQPRSMMELKSRPASSGISPQMPNSLSAGDLRVQSNNTVRFKKSMPSLSNYNHTIDEEEEEEEEEDEEDQERTLRRNGKKSLSNWRRHQKPYLNEFMEGDEEEEDADKDFIFDENLIQPQFLNKTSEASPLKLSPSQYEIVRDDALLTPRLHKRHRDWNALEQLDSFKESAPIVSRRRPAKSTSARSRIKIIKQEIDHNTPIKNGRMYYNPKTMKWEGNEQVLDKFSKLDSIDKKPLLIKTKSQTTNTTRQESFGKLSTAKPKASKRIRNPRIVGKMMFDDENLRWININGNDDEQDLFAGIKDVKPAFSGSPVSSLKGTSHVSPFLRSHSQLLPSTGDEYISDRLNSTRYHSLGATNRDSSSDPVFQMSSKLLEKFCHEENRWNRKVGAWFLLGNKEVKSGEVTKEQNSNSYMFEIRNMVINSTRA
ncbi:hypothetical protein HG536_0G04380 [Torulaspora globosa]|uniref:Mitotic check point protein BFA1 n=1 Tax=Torulaspora globosa TaxID=48254 RepID=A0A7G3ZM40_9SACH|nr:uncharacterized protein HG536_0G04380 [Torulaspora globosa]QLL34576.1 hypothetical protein HG536_0G04380 [Torulaspora globosa]